MGCDLSAIAGALARVYVGTSRRGRRRVSESRRRYPNRTAPPVPLTADMRTGPLVARRLSMRNGYGAAQHVRRKKEDG